MNPEQQKIIDLIHTISGNGQQLSDVLERGQAESPLTDHFRALEDELDTAPFSVVLLGLTPDSRSAALSWLYGEEFALLTVNVPKQLGLLEIDLRERGYMMEAGSGEHTEFEQIDSLLEAVRNSTLDQGEDNFIHPVRLGIESRHKLQALKVLMPENPALVLSNPSLLNRLVTESNLLIVAAPLKHELSKEDRQAFHEISQQMDAFWPFITVDELQDDISQIETGWWEQFDSVLTPLPPLLLTTHLEARIPELLNNRQAAIRQALFLKHQARRFESVVEALRDRQQQELQQLESRKKREQRKLAPTASLEQGNRFEWERLRQTINDEFNALGKNLQDRNRRALLPTSMLMEEVDQFLTTLSVSDLDQKDSHKHIRLKVHDDFLHSMRKQLASLLKSQVRDDLGLVQKEIQTIEKNLNDTTQRLASHPLNLHSPMPDERELWSQLKEMLTVDIRYQGELPKRGFFQRLGEGRRVVFTLLMTLGLIGSFAGFNVRSSRASGLIGVIFLLIFIGVFIYTFINWRKQDEITLEKEVEKLRQGVASEIKRLLNEIQRVKLDKLNDQLGNIKKTMLQSLDDLGRQTQTQQAEESQKQKQQTEQRLQMIERSRQELQGLNTGIQQLEQKTKQLQRLCSDHIESCLG